MFIEKIIKQTTLSDMDRVTLGRKSYDDLSVFYGGFSDMDWVTLGRKSYDDLSVFYGGFRIVIMKIDVCYLNNYFEIIYKEI